MIHHNKPSWFVKHIMFAFYWKQISLKINPISNAPSNYDLYCKKTIFIFNLHPILK